MTVSFQIQRTAAAESMCFQQPLYHCDWNMSMMEEVAFAQTSK